MDSLREGIKRNIKRELHKKAMTEPYFRKVCLCVSESQRDRRWYLLDHNGKTICSLSDKFVVDSLGRDLIYFIQDYKVGSQLPKGMTYHDMPQYKCWRILLNTVFLEDVDYTTAHDEKSISTYLYNKFSSEFPAAKRDDLLNAKAVEETRRNLPEYVRVGSNAKFYFNEPQKSKGLLLSDLIVTIARISRYNFHLQSHYSVAEHCYHCSFRCSSPIHALLHDLSEAIIGDMPAPIKKFCPDYKAIEIGVEGWIYTVFGVGQPPKDLKKVDSRMLSTEQMFFGRSADLMEEFPAYPDVRINCWEPVFAALKYFERLQELLDMKLSLDMVLDMEKPLK